MSNMLITRRDFGCMLGAGLVCAATRAGATSRARSAALPSQHAAAATARELIAKGEIGAVRFGHSTQGGCTTASCVDAVADAHCAQLLFLFEALQLQDEGRAWSVTAPDAAGALQTLMTSMIYPDGMRVEVCTAATPLAWSGCVIQGSAGSIRIAEDCLTLLSEDGRVRWRCDTDASAVSMDRLRNMTDNAAERRIHMATSIIRNAQQRA